MAYYQLEGATVSYSPSIRSYGYMRTRGARQRRITLLLQTTSIKNPPQKRRFP